MADKKLQIKKNEKISKYIFFYVFEDAESIFEVACSKNSCIKKYGEFKMAAKLDTFNKPMFCLQIHVLYVFEDAESIFYVYM